MIHRVNAASCFSGSPAAASPLLCPQPAWQLARPPSGPPAPLSLLHASSGSYRCWKSRHTGRFIMRSACGRASPADAMRPRSNSNLFNKLFINPLNPEKKKTKWKYFSQIPEGIFLCSEVPRLRPLVLSKRQVWSVWNDEKTEFLAEIDQTSHVLINGHNDILTLQSKFTSPNFSFVTNVKAFLFRELTSALQTFAGSVKRSIDPTINPSINHSKINHFWQKSSYSLHEFLLTFALLTLS